MTDAHPPQEDGSGAEPTPQEAKKLFEAGLDSEPQGGPAFAETRHEHGDAPSIEEIAIDFPQLEIMELIGRGGMGAVYKARQLHLDRIVALKVLHSRFLQDPQFVERFSREARALARLNHPNIVGLYDFGESNGRFFFLMEYVDGPNLRQMLQAQKLKPAEALAIVPKLCEALQYAHDEGIIHRDIKPENVLIDRKGRVKIADFGLAKLLGIAQPGHTLTQTGAIMGTPHYMAPEQLEHPQEVDHRVDVYALGVVFYEMLTGELPLGRFQPPSKKVDVDVRLDEVVLRAMEREPDRRYQHVSEVGTELETIASSSEAGSGASVSARERSRVSGARTATGQTTAPAGARVSILAVLASALMALPIVLIPLAAIGLRMATAGTQPEARPSPTWAFLAIPLLFGPLFLSPLLGAFAAVRIRRANGQLIGLPFALFPILFLIFAIVMGVFTPLWRYIYAVVLALDASSFARALGRPTYSLADQNAFVYWVLGGITAFFVTWFLGRRIYIACTPWVDRPERVRSPHRLAMWLIFLVPAIAVLLWGAGVFSGKMGNGPPAKPHHDITWEMRDAEGVPLALQGGTWRNWGAIPPDGRPRERGATVENQYVGPGSRRATLRMEYHGNRGDADQYSALLTVRGHETERQRSMSFDYLGAPMTLNPDIEGLTIVIRP
jgi:predicted Ser/Thr protein kinase